MARVPRAEHMFVTELRGPCLCAWRTGSRGRVQRGLARLQRDALLRANLQALGDSFTPQMYHQLPKSLKTTEVAEQGPQ